MTHHPIICKILVMFLELGIGPPYFIDFTPDYWHQMSRQISCLVHTFVHPILWQSSCTVALLNNFFLSFVNEKRGNTFSCLLLYIQKRIEKKSFWYHIDTSKTKYLPT